MQPFQFSCISSHNVTGGQTATLYCPDGSSRPLHTAEGYYAVRPHFEAGGGYGGQELCPRGSYCLEGMRHLCPAGRYGAYKQNTNASCTGLCTAGYYCPPGSITDMQVRCPDAASYCPTGSAAPVPVTLGYYTVGHDPVNYTFNVANFGSSEFAETARTDQSLCEPGFYCLADGTTHVPCEASYLLHLTVCAADPLVMIYRDQAAVPRGSLRCHPRPEHAELQRVLRRGILLRGGRDHGHAVPLRRGRSLLPAGLHCATVRASGILHR